MDFNEVVGEIAEWFCSFVQWIVPQATMSPAMAAGVTDRLWSVEDLVALWEA